MKVLEINVALTSTQVEQIVTQLQESLPQVFEHIFQMGVDMHELHEKLHEEYIYDDYEDDEYIPKDGECCGNCSYGCHEINGKFIPRTPEECGDCPHCYSPIDKCSCQ